MAVKLLYDIPASNFENIRDIIAAILKEELDAQAVRRGSGDPVVPDPDYTAAIYVDRFVPVGHGEGNVIAVEVVGGNTNHQTPISQSFECIFNIDIYTEARESAEGKGYYNSAVKLHRLAGLVRHILQSPYYDRLGLPNGIIERRSVSAVQFAQPNEHHNANFTRMGRVSLTCRFVESQNQITPITLAAYNTIIKLDETEKGFLLTYEN